MAFLYHVLFFSAVSQHLLSVGHHLLSNIILSGAKPMKDAIHDQHIKDITKLMRSISHPIRFKILCLLQDDELSVGDLRAELQTTCSNITQHLNILRNQGIIDFRKDANYIYNRISDARILELMRKMHQLYPPHN